MKTFTEKELREEISKSLSESLKGIRKLGLTKEQEKKEFKIVQVAYATLYCIATGDEDEGYRIVDEGILMEELESLKN